MKKTWTKTVGLAALVTSLLLSGCNGLLIVKRGPKAGDLNWAGRTVAWTGWNVIGAEPVMLDGAYPAEETGHE